MLIKAKVIHSRAGRNCLFAFSHFIHIKGVIISRFIRRCHFKTECRSNTHFLPTIPQLTPI